MDRLEKNNSKALKTMVYENSSSLKELNQSTWDK